MLRLSIQTRLALSRLTLPVLLGVCCGLMLLSRLHPVLDSRLQQAVGDRLAPLYGLLRAPLDRGRDLQADIRLWFGVRAQNARLRAENAELKRWVAVAMALAAENRALKANLRWLPDPQPRFVTARAVAEVGGIFGRAALLAAGRDDGLREGETAVDADGLVGRIIAIGARSARILLLSDPASRVPVTLERSRTRAMVAGDLGPTLRLLYTSEDSRPQEGERVVTSGEADAYPAGLPVGVVHYRSAHEAVVAPAADLATIDLVRILDYAPQAGPPSWPERRPGRVPGARAIEIQHG